MGSQVKPVEDALDIGIQDLPRRFSGIDHEQDGHQAAHDVGVAVGIEGDGRRKGLGDVGNEARPGSRIP